MNDAIKLIGIVIVVIGFVMKFDTLATVVVAGLVTGLISGMSIMDILNTNVDPVSRTLNKKALKND